MFWLSGAGFLSVGFLGVGPAQGLTGPSVAMAQDADAADADAGSASVMDPPDAPSSAQIAEALARYRHEPTVDALLFAIRQIEALDPQEAVRIARRARRAGLLPTLRMAGRRGQGVDLDERVGELRYSTDDRLTLEASLVWNLDRAVSGPQEAALLREAGRRLSERTAREQLLIQAYFERRRLQLERDLLGADGLERVLRIRELEALLDALTEGAFSRHAAQPRVEAPRAGATEGS